LFYKALWPLEKQSHRRFRGYPVATIAFYGADAERATKVAVGIIPAEDADADPLRRWSSEHTDVRSEQAILREIGEFIETHAVKSVCARGPHHRLPARRRGRLPGGRRVSAMPVLGESRPLVRRATPMRPSPRRQIDRPTSERSGPASPAAQPARSAPWTDA
jgi:hypothetical protein